jgi:hypothetical protein
VSTAEAEYRADPGVNFSTLKLMARSAAAYRHGYGGDDGDTASRAVLRLIHAAVLEPHTIARDFHVIPDAVRRSPAVTAEAAGRTVIKTADLATAQAMAAAVAAHSVAGPMLAGVPAHRREHTLRWTDPPTGLPCKGRLDALAIRAPGQGVRATVVDLKTVRSCAPREIARMAASMHWHVQAAHYVAGVRANQGLSDDAVDAVLIAMEQAPPHDVGVYRLTPDGALWAGEVTRRAWLDRLAECLRSGVWPGACPEEQELELPGWAYPAEADPLSDDDDDGGLDFGEPQGG